MSQRIRVATWNLYLGADLGLLLGHLPPSRLAAAKGEVLRQLQVTAFPQRAYAIAQLLVREQVDVVGLQEVCTWHSDGELMWDGASELCTALEKLGEPYDVVVSQPSFRGSGSVEDAGRPVTMWLEGRNVILRRRSSAVHVEAPSAGVFGNALTVSLMGAIDVTIDRGWCAAQCWVEGAEPFSFVNTHTEAYDAASRDRQRDELTGLLPTDPRVVVVGDFNATPDDVGMPSDLTDAWTAAGNDGTGPEAATCCRTADLTDPESGLADRIDYIWLRGLEVDSCVRIGADPDDRTEPGDGTGQRLWPSDHAGLVATLRL